MDRSSNNQLATHSIVFIVARRSSYLHTCFTKESSEGSFPILALEVSSAFGFCAFWVFGALKDQIGIIGIITLRALHDVAPCGAKQLLKGVAIIKA